MDDYVNVELERVVDWHRQRLVDIADEMSPIEKAFFFALCACEIDDVGGAVRIPIGMQITWPIWGKNHRYLSKIAGNPQEPEPLFVYPQVRLDPFELDFVLIRFDMWTETILAAVAVECDGHDYHERTKEQASRDKRKDRAIQAAGLDIFRFSGSDIYHDAPGCARETLGHLKDLAERRAHGLLAQG